MTDPNELAPSTSYSDPFYDRLDACARMLRRYWHVAVAIVIIAVCSAILLRWSLATHPEAGGAVAFLHAQEQAQTAGPDRAKALAAYAEVLADSTTTPYFRARAAIEQIHLNLLNADVPAARTAAEQANAAATVAKDPALLAAVRLSQAAIELQAEQLDAALAAYTEAATLAGPRQPALQLDAMLGQARVQERQGKQDEAIATLEPLITRSDAGAESLVVVAKARYWRLKRLQAEAALPKPVESAVVAPPVDVVAPVVSAPEAPLAPAADAPASK